MSTETTDQDAGGGDDLRSRYLPVSRKELRRRREAELAAQREAQEAADAAADELAGERVSLPGPPPSGTAEDEERPDEERPGESRDPGEAELERTVDDVESAETPAPTVEEPPAQDELHAGVDRDTEPALETSPEADSEPEVAPAPEAETGTGLDTAAEVDAEPEERGEDDDAVAPSDLEDSADLGAGDIDDEDAEDAPLPEPVADEPERPEEEIAEAFEATSETLEDTEAVPAEGGLPPVDEPEEEAPIPASRRARRLLRDTENIPSLDTSTLTQLDQITQEISRSDDPENPDPELLKKQQALAAKAMQANRERLRREEEEKAREQRRRRRERPESEVITGRAVRDSLDDEELEYTEYLTGSIEPVEAKGAHGLDIAKLVDETSREANRPNILLILVIVLAVLLVAAVAVVVYFLLG
ncbi:hypothetical protein [Nesterenkonia alba]|uniref:hypothetical protein n=1 Tax=Nesterenkonia alba TaxID=515814 RepID=UPI0003B36D7D|nr:hypothetical protein [Nesterenkonia alba]